MAKRPPKEDSRAAELAAREAAMAEGIDLEPTVGAMVVNSQSEQMNDGRPFDEPAASPAQMHDGRAFDELPSLEQLEAAAKDLSIDVSAGYEQLVPQALELIRASEALAAKACEVFVSAGLLLLAARRDYPYGEWLPYLENQGIVPARAQEAMRIAGRYAQLSPGARQQLVSGGKVKAITLVRLDEETLEAAHASGELAKLAALPKAKLLEHIRKLNKQNQDLQADLEIADAKAKAAANDEAASSLTRRDLGRRRKKLAAHGIAELAQRSALEAVRLLTELTEPQWLPTAQPDDAAADKAMCTSVAVELEAAKAAWDEVFTTLQTQLKGRLAVHRDDLPIMSRAEIAEARKRRATVAEFTQKEFDNLTALNYARDALDDATDRGATPKAFRKLRKA